MKILLGYDGSDCADAALNDIQRAGLPDSAHVLVLSVIEHWLPPPSSLEVLAVVDRRMEAEALAQSAAVHLRALKPGWTIETEPGFGSPATVLLERAERWQPDLIVVGSHGRSALGRFFLGSVSQKLVHNAHCTVRVARERDSSSDMPVRLVIGVDGSAGAAAAVQTAADRVWPANSEVLLVCAAWGIPPVTSEHMVGRIAEWVTEENARVKRMVAQAEKQLQGAGLKVSVLVKEEEPKRLLVQEAENQNADCIFVGARGTSALERFMIGSVSSGVAARAHCSVEVVRPPITH